MAFKGTEPIRSKIIIKNILEHVNIFTYLGYNISYQNETDIHSKITKFLQILGLLNNTMKPNLIQRSTRLKLYKILALPTLLYSSEIWTLETM
jgi:transposase